MVVVVFLAGLVVVVVVVVVVFLLSAARTEKSFLLQPLFMDHALFHQEAKLTRSLPIYA